MRKIHTVLKDWLLKSLAKERVIEAFWICFNNYRAEDPEEFMEYFSDYDKENISFEYSKASITLRGWDRLDNSNNDENMECIETLISVLNKGVYIGYYTLVYNNQGEIIDDRLVWV